MIINLSISERGLCQPAAGNPARGSRRHNNAKASLPLSWLTGPSPASSKSAAWREQPAGRARRRKGKPGGLRRGTQPRERATNEPRPALARSRGAPQRTQTLAAPPAHVSRELVVLELESRLRPRRAPGLQLAELPRGACRGELERVGLGGWGYPQMAKGTARRSVV